MSVSIIRDTCPSVVTPEPRCGSIRGLKAEFIHSVVTVVSSILLLRVFSIACCCHLSLMPWSPCHEHPARCHYPVNWVDNILNINILARRDCNTLRFLHIIKMALFNRKILLVYEIFYLLSRNSSRICRRCEAASCSSQLRHIRFEYCVHEPAYGE